MEIYDEKLRNDDEEDAHGWKGNEMEKGWADNYPATSGRLVEDVGRKSFVDFNPLVVKRARGNSDRSGHGSYIIYTFTVVRAAIGSPGVSRARRFN